MLNVENIRQDFPILSRKINGQPLIYFDNAATSHTPKQVIDVMQNLVSLESFEIPTRLKKDLVGLSINDNHFSKALTIIRNSP